MLDLCVLDGRLRIWWSMRFSFLFYQRGLSKHSWKPPTSSVVVRFRRKTKGVHSRWRPRSHQRWPQIKSTGTSVHRIHFEVGHAATGTARRQHYPTMITTKVRLRSEKSELRRRLGDGEDKDNASLQLLVSTTSSQVDNGDDEYDNKNNK